MKATVIEYISSMVDGGAETLVKDYARLLDQEKFRVLVLATRPHGDTANLRTLQKLGISYAYIYPKWNFAVRVFNKLFGFLYRPYRVLYFVRKEKAAALHIHLELLKTVKRIGNKLKDVKLLYTCHNLPRLMFSEGEEAEYDAAKYLIENNGLQLIALHDDMRQELNQMFGVDSTIVIRNGIDVNRFAEVPENRRDTRKSIGLPEDAFVVGHVGRFTEGKNHDFLVDIFEEIAKRREDAYLLLIGIGHLKEKIENKIKALGLENRTVFLSGRTDMPQLMKAMDVLVFPSRFEGLPVTLVEAQASGLRCVVSDRITEEAFLTELITAADIEDSAGHWADLALQEDLRGPYNQGLDAFDMQKIVKQLEKLYVR